MDPNDARYERPCRWLLAVAAAMHWITAALLYSEHLQADSQLEVGGTFAGVLRALIQSLT
jgi:hypothetical protein